MAAVAAVEGLHVVAVPGRDGCTAAVVTGSSLRLRLRTPPPPPPPMLFFQQTSRKGIFGNGNKDNNEAEEKCHEELAKVSDRILKKCAGVPLAIITMASLLACKARNKMEWYEVYNSVGTGLENNLDVENMRKILSFSYYELPCHLRVCLLYLSMFPEDYEIEKDHLIRMWIGEGFIQCEKAGKSLFELGESYFNELINRSMIQPIHNSSDDMISSCRVHDMVLDLIRSLSSEENFVTLLSDMGGTSPSNTIRRLSLQNGQDVKIDMCTSVTVGSGKLLLAFTVAAQQQRRRHCRGSSGSVARRRSGVGLQGNDGGCWGHIPSLTAAL
ncbi:disease resistance protein Pik-2-like [Miscanthus floridulus]|uniref:disease resistance protein Pik-2-like n=1 Tax=Miscanthus floridulus TaxID=154761 RepID=UPI003458FBEB